MAGQVRGQTTKPTAAKMPTAKMPTAKIPASTVRAASIPTGAVVARKAAAATNGGAGQNGEALTDRQKKILSIIEHHMADFGRPPTIREIGSKAGISSTSVVNYHLNKLQVLGHVDRSGQVSRGLKLNTLNGLKLGSPRGIPLLGKIAAGSPIPVPEPMSLGDVDADNLLDLGYDTTLTEKAVYALEVQGTSMIDALVGDGDIVVMEPVEDVANGQMAAVWIKDQEATTLKKFYREANGAVRLQPANPLLEAKYYDEDNVRIMGRVVSVVRRMN